MKIRFWGVRGSVAVCGPQYVATGGNTSCVEVEQDGERIVFDGGTGLRAFGDSLGFAPATVSVLFSHYHWDHIQGVPFFVPAYNPSSDITFAGVRFEGAPGVRELLDRQMQPPTFPVGLDLLAGVKRFVDLEVGAELELGPFKVRVAEQPHPNRSAAFRVEAGGKAMVYATDTEHGMDDSIDPRLIDLARDADLLIHDAQYTDDEYLGRKGPSRRGWGHSTWREAIAAAQQAGVRRVALYHHDPSRDDDAIEDIEATAREEFAGAFVAREGHEVEL